MPDPEGSENVHRHVKQRKDTAEERNPQSARMVIQNFSDGSDQGNSKGNMTFVATARDNETQEDDERNKESTCCQDENRPERDSGENLF